MKQCSQCGETKPLDQFHKSKNHKGGVHCWCKDCIRTYSIERIAKIRENRAPPESDTKRCTKCLRDLPLAMFGANSQSKDGFDWRCKKCRHDDRDTVYEANLGLNRGQAAAKSKRQNRVAQYGESVVEAMEMRSRMSEDEARKLINGF